MPTDRAPYVARYRLAERLGAGGLGVVMAAEDPELGRRVAIKLIRMGSTDRRAFERLEREASALARVSHPHVVGVFDVGRYDAHDSPTNAWPVDVPMDGVYIVMELCEGKDLAAWLRTPRTPEEVLRVFRAAGAGLAAAHAAGVVHRDFKPANVVVDGAGGVKVLDFGLAQWLHGAEPSTLQEGVEDGGPVEPSSMTMTGTVMGTPAYMAPEQHRGGKLDERSDQYAFCVALTEALCGTRPFAGDTVAQIHQAKHDLRFDARMREISPRLRAVLERGLAREPDARWPGMVELLRALEEPRSYAAWWGMGLLVGVVGLAGWVAVGSTRPSEPVALAPEPAAAAARVDGNPPSAEAKALREAAEIASVGLDSRASLAALLERAAPRSTIPDEPSLGAEVLLWRGRLADDAAASEIYRRAYFVAREADVPSIAARAAIAMTTTAGEDHGQLLDEWIRHAWVEVERVPDDRGATVEVAIRAAHGRAIGMGDELAVESLAFAIAVVGDVEPTDGIYVAHLLLELSGGLRAVDELDLALEWARRAETLIDAVAAPDHPLHAHVAAEIGRNIYWLDYCQEALPPFEAAMAGFTAMGPEGDEEAALVRGLFAECLHDVGRLEAAMAEYRSSIEFWETTRPELAVPQQRAHLELARILRELGRTAEAEQEYERVLLLYDPNVPDNATRMHAREELAELRGG